MVIATQNPIEHEGTYPLPESQLDRFLMRISRRLPRPGRRARRSSTPTASTTPSSDLRPVVDVRRRRRPWPTRPAPSTWPRACRATSSTWPRPPAATPHPLPGCRRGPRSPSSGRRRARAAAAGRAYVVPDDIKALAEPVLAHRLLVTPEAQLAGTTPADALAEARPVRAGARGPAVRRSRRPRADGARPARGWCRPRRAAVVALRRRSDASDSSSSTSSPPACWPSSASPSAGCCATRLELEVGRHLSPRRVHAGQPARVELTVATTAIAATPVLRLHDPVTGTQGATVLLSPGRGRGRRSASAYRLPTERRGLVGIGPLVVVVADPFGLAAVDGRGRRHHRAHRAAPGRRHPAARPWPAATTRSPACAPATLAASAGDDFYALRAYVVGDDLRRVHWPSSARHDDLLVRQDEVPWQGRTTSCSTPAATPTPTTPSRPPCSAAASIITAAWKRRDLVRLVTTAGLGLRHRRRQRPRRAAARRAGPGQHHPPGTLRGAARRRSAARASGAVVVVAGASPIRREASASPSGPSVAATPSWSPPAGSHDARRPGRRRHRGPRRHRALRHGLEPVMVSRKGR